MPKKERVNALKMFLPDFVLVSRNILVFKSSALKCINWWRGAVGVNTAGFRFLRREIGGSVGPFVLGNFDSYDYLFLALCVVD